MTFITRLKLTFSSKKTPSFYTGCFPLANILFLMSWSNFKAAKIPLYRSSSSKLHYNSIRTQMKMPSTFPRYISIY